MTPQTVEQAREALDEHVGWITEVGGVLDRETARKYQQLRDALIEAVRLQIEAELMAERPTEPLKLNLYGRACYRAGQQSRLAEEKKGV